MGKPTPEQLARINQLAKKPLTEDQVYVFNAKLIGDNVIPTKSMRVTPNFLRKMLDQAKEGVSLLIDHSWDNLGVMTFPYGRTFDATLRQEPDGELALYADHYIVYGQTFNGVSTDEIISAIEAGTMFDTSIGYIPTSNVCSIDNMNYYSGNCPHFRGKFYDGQQCIISQDDGELMENSLVFDGAYPGAGVVAASKSHTQEWFQAEDAASIKQGGRILCSYSKKSGLQEFVNNHSKKEGDGSMNELEQMKQQLSAVQSVLSSVREKLKVSSDTDIAGALATLSAKSKLGEQYSAKVVDEALGAGVRALGEAFNADAMKLALSNLPVSEVEKIRDTYEAQAQVALGGGGRKTQPEHHDLPTGKPANPQGEVNLSAAEKQEKSKEEARAALAKHGYKHMLKDGE